MSGLLLLVTCYVVRVRRVKPNAPLARAAGPLTSVDDVPSQDGASNATVAAANMTTTLVGAVL